MVLQGSLVTCKMLRHNHADQTRYPSYGLTTFKYSLTCDCITISVLPARHKSTFYSSCCNMGGLASTMWLSNQPVSTSLVAASQLGLATDTLCPTWSFLIVHNKLNIDVNSRTHLCMVKCLQPYVNTFCKKATLTTLLAALSLLST